MVPATVTGITYRRWHLCSPPQVRFRKQGSSPKYLNFGDSKIRSISCQWIGLDCRIRGRHSSLSCEGIVFDSRKGDQHLTISCHGIRLQHIGGTISLCCKIGSCSGNKEHSSYSGMGFLECRIGLEGREEGRAHELPKNLRNSLKSFPASAFNYFCAFEITVNQTL